MLDVWRGRIMVLDSGVMAEMDSPAVLMEKPDSIFYGLWQRHQQSHGPQRRGGSRDNLAALAAAEAKKTEGETEEEKVGEVKTIEKRNEQIEL